MVHNASHTCWTIGLVGHAKSAVCVREWMCVFFCTDTAPVTFYFYNENNENIIKTVLPARYLKALTLPYLM